MSNKLAKHQELKELLTVKQRKVLFWGLLSVMVIAFIAVWANIAVTSHAFNKQMEDMILGEDYFIEDIVITDKRIESGVSDDDISQNYFFYYHDGKIYEYSKHMQVPASVYSEYDVGEKIAAYTNDHIRYSYYKEGILPKDEYTHNEIMKAVGALLGAGICFNAFTGLIIRIIAPKHAN